MNKQKLKPLKGFRDRYPEDMAIWNAIQNVVREAAEQFGFQEYDGPLVEPMSLYADKTSRELLEEQSFAFQDRKERDIMLRPEMTPTLARMIAARAQELTLPIRLYNIGQRFRYEAPQKGRDREFYQMDFDILGSDSMTADIEILAFAIELLTRLGAEQDDFTLYINARDIMQSALEDTGVQKKIIPAVIQIIDKRDKVDEKIFIEMLEEEGVQNDAIQNILELLSSNDYKDYFTDFLSLADDYGIADYVEVDPAIVRGFDYYTGLVFEAKASKGLNRSLLGGGRYNNLVAQYGKDNIPGIGFAISDTILMAFLEDIDKLPQVNPVHPDVLVTIFSEETQGASTAVTRLIRNTGASCEMYTSLDKLGKQLSYANNRDIPYVIVVGPDEIKKSEVVIKNMEEASQESVPLEELPATIQKLTS